MKSKTLLIIGAVIAAGAAIYFILFRGGSASAAEGDMGGMGGVPGSAGGPGISLQATDSEQRQEKRKKFQEKKSLGDPDPTKNTDADLAAAKDRADKARTKEGQYVTDRKVQGKTADKDPTQIRDVSNAGPRFGGGSGSLPGSSGSGFANMEAKMKNKPPKDHESPPPGIRTDIMNPGSYKERMVMPGSGSSLVTGGVNKPSGGHRF